MIKRAFTRKRQKCNVKILDRFLIGFFGKFEV